MNNTITNAKTQETNDRRMALHSGQGERADRYFSTGYADKETQIGPKVFKMSQVEHPQATGSSTEWFRGPQEILKTIDTCLTCQSNDQAHLPLWSAAD